MGLVFPGALQQNTPPSRVGTMEFTHGFIRYSVNGHGLLFRMSPYNQNLLPKA